MNGQYSYFKSSGQIWLIPMKYVCGVFVDRTIMALIVKIYIVALDMHELTLELFYVSGFPTVNTRYFTFILQS
jgi:hypothetical protein